MINQLTKQPSEAYTHNALFEDFTAAAITSVDGITITARGLVAEVLALTQSGVVTSGTTVQFKLSGGTDGEEYLITIKVTDANGDNFELDVELRVEDFTWSVPDGVGAIYITPGDYVTRFGYAEAVLLSDTYEIGRIDKNRLGMALIEASALADGYVARRYQLPLSPAPEIIKNIVGDLARYNLHGDGVPEAVEKRQSQAMANLKAISKGDLVLAAPEITSATSAAGPDFISPDRVFDRNNLKGF